MRELLFFPCNGNTCEALDSLEPDDKLLGFIDDDPEKQGKTILGYPVFSREAIVRYPKALVLALPGNPSNFRERRSIIGSLNITAGQFATCIHPRAAVSQHARLGRNVYIGPGAVVLANANIGDHVCVLPNSVIHHDSTIGDYTLVGSNCTIAGFVHIGANSYIGSGSSIRDHIVIGDEVLVGMGSTVVADVAGRQTVFGNPAKPQ